MNYKSDKNPHMKRKREGERNRGLATSALAVGDEISGIDPVPPMLQGLADYGRDFVIFARDLHCA